jgi:hypothetical protein
MIFKGNYQNVADLKIKNSTKPKSELGFMPRLSLLLNQNF